MFIGGFYAKFVTLMRSIIKILCGKSYFRFDKKKKDKDFANCKIVENQTAASLKKTVFNQIESPLCTLLKNKK